VQVRPDRKLVLTGHIMGSFSATIIASDGHGGVAGLPIIAKIIAHSSTPTPTDKAPIVLRTPAPIQLGKLGLTSDVGNPRTFLTSPSGGELSYSWRLWHGSLGRIVYDSLTGALAIYSLGVSGIDTLEISAANSQGDSTGILVTVIGYNTSLLASNVAIPVVQFQSQGRLVRGIITKAQSKSLDIEIIRVNGALLGHQTIITNAVGEFALEIPGVEPCFVHVRGLSGTIFVSGI